MNDPRFHIDRDTLIVDGLSRSYRLMHMSDSHMSPDSPLDDEPTRARAAKQRETRGDPMTNFCVMMWAIASAVAKLPGMMFCSWGVLMTGVSVFSFSQLLQA